MGWAHSIRVIFRRCLGTIRSLGIDLSDGVKLVLNEHMAGSIEEGIWQDMLGYWARFAATGDPNSDDSSDLAEVHGKLGRRSSRSTRYVEQRRRASLKPIVISGSEKITYFRL